MLNILKLKINKTKLIKVNKNEKYFNVVGDAKHNSPANKE